MKVLFLSSEMAPFAKTGGLADVAGSLPLELARLGVETAAAMPRYRGLPSGVARASGVPVWFIENEAFFNRASLYGDQRGDYPDNLERFAFFCRRALALAEEKGFKPDLVHVNDWQTALVPLFLKEDKRPFFRKTRSLLTIHNLTYQGVFAHRHFPELGLPKDRFSVDCLEFWGRINLLKGGLVSADALNTVSPTYAREIQTREFGDGLDGVLRDRADRLKGILNGIDAGLWNPRTDRALKARFDARSLEKKALCKTDLQARCGLETDPGIPLFGIVSRLAEQKGMDLFTEIADRFLERRVQLVVLGEGDAVYHTAFKNIATRHPKNTHVRLGFDAEESHRIYAGCDFFLMPSYFEPCGLGQMIGLRYGTVPVARRTGGLADTVVDASDAKRGNGLLFDGRTGEGLWKALERSLGLYADGARFADLRRRGMQADYSWNRSAGDYVKYYKEIIGGRKQS